MELPRKHLPRTKSLSSRDGKTKSETLNFRKVARQVMLANMFTRRRPNVQSQMSAKKAAGAEPGFVGNRIPRKNRTIPEKPPLNRRGTPELFPMSDEMKQTVISLGKLDLLPDGKRESHMAAETKLEKLRTGSKFRDKTRQRIIHPQRFIRNVRSSVNTSEITVEKGVRCEENIIEENSGCEESQKDKEECFNNNKVSDGILSRTKLGCNVLSRPQSTHPHCNAKSAKSQYFSLARRPLLPTRYSDLGPVSAKTAVRRTRSQGSTWPVQNHAFADSRISSTRQQYFSKMGRNTTKAWVAGSEISRSMEERDENKHEVMQTRRWRSVESLTREIEEKCLSWLENRYGVVR